MACSNYDTAKDSSGSRLVKSPLENPAGRPRVRKFLAVVALSIIVGLIWSGRMPSLAGPRYTETTPVMGAKEISQKQSARLHKVADLLLDIYQTLARMRYIDPESIQPGPHNIDSLRPLYEELGLDSSIIYLYSILPYIDTEVAGNGDFLHGSSFANFLDPDDVEQGRDPFYSNPEGDDYNSDNGLYMQPWFTPLSMMGNHQSVIIYDARRHRIWIIDQESWASSDPGMGEGVWAVLDRGSDYDDGDSRLDENRNSFIELPSRPAETVLRDIKTWFLALKEVPGSNGDNTGGEWSAWDDVLDLRGLYRKHGWPSDEFDGDGFLIDQARRYCASQAKWDAEQPLYEVKKFEGWLGSAEQDIQRNRDAVAQAKTKDEEWTARYDLWKVLRRKEINIEDLARARKEAHRLCPNGVCQKPEDLPLWEFEMLTREARSKEESVVSAENDLAEGAEGPLEERRLRAQLRHAEEAAEVYRKAYEASKTDAERLCRGRTFVEAMGLRSPGRPDSRSRLESERNFEALLQREVDATKAWAAKIPEGASKVKEHVEQNISELEKGLESLRGTIRNLGEGIGEHGDSD